MNNFLQIFFQISNIKKKIQKKNSKKKLRNKNSCFLKKKCLKDVNVNVELTFLNFFFKFFEKIAHVWMTQFYYIMRIFVQANGNLIRSSRVQAQNYNSRELKTMAKDKDNEH
jgi:hypothetical protein